MTDRSKILPTMKRLYTAPSGCPRCGAKWHTETTKKLAEAVVGVLFCILCAQELRRPDHIVERVFWRNWSRQMRSKKA